jgi:hypothetical protein
LFCVGCFRRHLLSKQETFHLLYTGLLMCINLFCRNCPQWCQAGDSRGLREGAQDHRGGGRQLRRRQLRHVRPRILPQLHVPVAQRQDLRDGRRAGCQCAGHRAARQHRGCWYVPPSLSPSLPPSFLRSPKRSRCSYVLFSTLSYETNRTNTNTNMRLLLFCKHNLQARPGVLRRRLPLSSLF